jgi:hypothetical protein
MKAVLDELRMFDIPNYRVTSGTHRVFLASHNDLSNSWSEFLKFGDIIIPMFTFTTEESRLFLSKNLRNLKEDGCILVPHKVLTNGLEIGLMFALGADYIGPEPASGIVLSDTSDQLSNMIIDLIFCKDLE